MGVESDSRSLPTGTDAPANGAGNAGPPVFPTHPLGPLSAEEIVQTSSLIEQYWPSGTLLHFKSVKLREPAKKELAPFLVAERAGGKPAAIDRRSEVLYYIKNTVGLSPPPLGFLPRYSWNPSRLKTSNLGQTSRSRGEFDSGPG